MVVMTPSTIMPLPTCDNCNAKECILGHSCSVRTVRTLRLGKSSGTLWNFITDMELYGTILILYFARQSVVVVDSSACSTRSDWF